MTTMSSSKREEDIVYTENGIMMFNPYNEQNVEITLSEVQSILKKYKVNYNIHNIHR